MLGRLDLRGRYQLVTLFGSYYSVRDEVELTSLVRLNDPEHGKGVDSCSFDA